MKRMKKPDKHKAAKEEIAAIYHENRDRYSDMNRVKGIHETIFSGIRV